MKKNLNLIWPALLTVGILALIAAVPGPPSTEFTRGFGRVTNQTEAQAYLGVAGGGSSTNPASTIYVTNIFSTNITVQTITAVTNQVTVMKGGHITISNSFTIVTNATMTFSNMPWPSVMIVGADGNLTNAVLSGITLSGNTLTASGGSASPWMPNATLTYSGGTNVTIDGSGGTNFFLPLTNTAFFVTPANVPASKSTNTIFTIYFQQDSTGGRLVTWTNGSFKFPGGSLGVFQPDTNANAVSSVSFSMSPATNGIFMADYGVQGIQ